MVDRHVDLNAVVTQLAADVKSLSGQSAPSVQQLAQVYVDMLDEVKKTVDQIDNKLDLMQNVLNDVSVQVCMNELLCQTSSPGPAAVHMTSAQKQQRHDPATRSHENNY